MVERKTVQLKRLANGRSEEIRWGRWLRNKKVTEKMLIQSELSRTSQLVKGRHVLAIQDTTEINYQAHVKRVRGLGTVGNGKDVGLYLHPLLVIDADKKACIGFGAMKTWLRKSASPDYAKLPIESKESYRWIETAEQGKETLKEADVVTFVGDRESDIYEYLDRIPDERYHLLTRCSQKHRCLSNGQKLEEYLSSLKEAAQLRITVPREMRKGRVKRQADLSIKYGEIEIQRPANRKDNQGSKTVKLRVVEAKESHVPEGQKPIHWILLTTHEVNSPEEAKQIIGWYQCRWQIEQLFRTLKSQGLNIE